MDPYFSQYHQHPPPYPQYQMGNPYMEPQSPYKEFNEQMGIDFSQQQALIQQQAPYPQFGGHPSQQFPIMQPQIQNLNYGVTYQPPPGLAQVVPKQVNELRPLYVVVIPMETNQSPYQMELKIKGNETSLKQVFDENINNYWTKVFKGHSPREPPSYRQNISFNDSSVFRKQMNIEANYFSEFLGKSLHILLLKCEGYKFPRNPNAHLLELFCNTHFYGPLVVAMNMNHVPYHLDNFKVDYIQEVIQINEQEKRQYPPPFTPTNSQKKNKTMRFYVSEKVTEMSEDLQKLKEQMDPDMFYIYRYKTAYCPQKNVKHDWASCIYAHRPQDFRRAPDTFAYYPDDCSNFTADHEESCPLGFKCKFSHSTYERLYHPLKYKTNSCDQIRTKRKICKRGSMCAFFHEMSEKRQPQKCQKSQLFYNNMERSQMNSDIMYPTYQPNPHTPQKFNQHYSPQVQMNQKLNQFQMVADLSPNLIKQPPQIFDIQMPQRTFSNSWYEQRPLYQQNYPSAFNPHPNPPVQQQSRSYEQNNFLNSLPKTAPSNFSLSPLNPELSGGHSSSDSEQNNQPRRLSLENAFASGGGLPFLSEFKCDEGQDEDMEMHIDEETKDKILQNIYSKRQHIPSNDFSSSSTEVTNKHQKEKEEKVFSLIKEDPYQNPTQSEDLSV